MSTEKSNPNNLPHTPSVNELINEYISIEKSLNISISQSVQVHSQIMIDGIEHLYNIDPEIIKPVAQAISEMILAVVTPTTTSSDLDDIVDKHTITIRDIYNER